MQGRTICVWEVQFFCNAVDMQILAVCRRFNSHDGKREKSF